MGTKLGKLLVLANAFVSIGLLAWAVSIYTNRLPYFDGKDGETATTGLFSQYTTEIKRLTDGVQLAQGGYVRAMDNLVFMEQDRSYRQYVLNIHLDEVRKQGNANALFRVLTRHTEPELRGLVDVYKWGPANQFPAAQDLRNRPLQGFGLLQQRLRNLLKDENDLAAKIRTFRTDTNKLSLEINNPDDATGLQPGVQPEVFKMKAIFQNLGDEEQFLADAQVNWEEQLRTLKIRKQQLTDRLAEFAKPAGTTTSGGQ